MRRRRWVARKLQKEGRGVKGEVAAAGRTLNSNNSNC